MIGIWEHCEPFQKSTMNCHNYHTCHSTMQWYTALAPTIASYPGSSASLQTNREEPGHKASTNKVVHQINEVICSTLKRPNESTELL